MVKHFVVSAMALISALAFLPSIHAQEPGSRPPGAVYDADKKGEKSGPAPKRSLAGTWEPA